MDSEKMLKEFRKKPLFDAEALTGMDIGIEGIEKIIPHRPPMLLVDSITGIDIGEGRVAGNRFIDPADPLLAGHFPGFPVYPGVLEVEMIGQMGLCMYYFVTNNRTDIADDAQPVDIRASRIIGAHYLQPLLPGSTATILAKQLDFDGFFGTAIGQIIADGKVCCTAIGEVVFP